MMLVCKMQGDIRIFSVIVVSFLSVSVHSNDDVISYYEHLIKTNINESLHYVLPTAYDEFVYNNTEKSYDLGYYDFIIVGAGTAGCVLARRLSEVKEWNVLLIEAGGEENNFTDIVGMATYLLASDKNWGFYTTPQTNSCLAKQNSSCGYPRGKGIGGTSVINSAIYSRGSSLDYDMWEKSGQQGWSYKDVLPYFIKSERNLFGGDPKYHGFSGPLPASHPKETSKLVDVFIEANKHLNIELIDDYNGPTEKGVSIVQLNEENGVRYSTGKAFLNPSRINKNLRVITHALVTKIIINNSTKTAEGVELIHGGRKYTAACKKEIILSAGAVNTPQILMLSGVGPKQHLESLGIEVIQDLPVGQNLKDHVVYAALRFRSDFVVRPKTLKEIIQEFVVEGKGKLTSAITESVVYLNVDNETDKPPNVQLILLPQNPVSDLPGRQKASSNYKDEFVKTSSEKLNGSSDFTIGLVLLKPKSEGEVKLKSTNPLDFPEINTNLLTDPGNNDADYLYKGIQFILKLINTKPFKGLNTRLISEMPQCEHLVRYSKDYWYCAIKYIASPAYHTTSTTKMGLNDKTAVVDKHLKVYGLQRLRIVDAGVIPHPLSGHTCAPVIMIAEKISDSIKNEYQRL